MNRARRSALDLVIDALALASAALLLLITVLIVADVCGRTLRLFSLSWVLEATEYMLYGLTFFGAPWLLREQGHIAIEILVERLPVALRRKTQRLAHGLGAVICAVLFVYGCRVVWSSYQSGVMVQKSFAFPEWTAFIIVPPVMLLLLGIYLRWLGRPPAPAAEAAGEGI